MWFWQFFGIFQGIVFEPGDVQLVAALLYLAQAELAESAGFAQIFPGATAIGIRAVTRLELGKMLGHQGAVFLGDAWDIGAGIENPGILGRQAFLKKDDVGLDALAVRGERASGQPQHGMQVAIFHEDFAHFASRVLEQAIVRQHHGCASARFERAHHVLYEIELFVAGLDRKIITVGLLVGALGAEGRIGQHTVVTFAPVCFINRVAQVDSRL